MALSQDVSRQLAALNLAIQQQIDLVADDAKETGCKIEELKYPDGKFVLTDLLLAKSNVLLALTILEDGRK